MDILANYDCKNLSEDAVGFDSILLSDIDAVPVKKKKKSADTGNTKKEESENTAAPAKKSASKVKTEDEKQEPQHKTDIKLTGDAKLVYNYLSAKPVHIDKIADDLGMPVNRVLGTLTLLEVQGLAQALQGRNFVLK